MLLFLIVAQVGADNRKEMFLHLLMVACTGLCYDSSWIRRKCHQNWLKWTGIILIWYAILIKEVMPWPKVFRFWSLPRTNGPNTQWKLRYSPIQCAYLEPSAMHFQNWPRDVKWTQSCWCLHWFLGFHSDVWKNLLQVHTRLVVTQVWIDKMCSKGIEIGFQNAVFHLCQRALVPLLCNDRAEHNGLYLGQGKTPQSTSYNFSFLQYYVQFQVLLNVMRD